MKQIGTVVFNGAYSDTHSYQLGIELYKSLDPMSTCNGRVIINVYQNFQGDDLHQRHIPSGWFIPQVMDLDSLCIDSNSEWFVYPTPEAWEEIREMIKNL